MAVSAVSRFIEQLYTLENHERAQAHAQYNKSQRVHLGLTVPEITQLVGETAKKLSPQELLELAYALWETDIFDAKIAATKITGLPKLKPSPELWNFVIFCLPDLNGWALEDQLAHTAWKCILADLTLLDTLEQWTKHQSFWIRRAALIYTLPFAKKGRDPERMLSWAAKYSSDTEWFIQKAIGWWLRDLGKHNPERVLKFLKDHAHNLKYVAKHEATRLLKKDN